MTNNLKVLVTTSDKSFWTLRPFAYLFNTYWSENQAVDVLCESIPKFKLPGNFKYHPANIQKDGKWPRNKWTDGLIKYLESITEQFVLIMLDDYWIPRTVDIGGIRTLHEYMTIHRNILRIDLTTDRLYAGGPKYPANDPDHGLYGHYHLINRPNTEYQMSLMPGIWNKKLLLGVIEEGWTPWDVELNGTSVVNANQDLIVLGTRQWPLMITNALRDATDTIDTSDIHPTHLEKIKKWFPPRK